MLISVMYVAKLRLIYQKQEFKMRHGCKSHTRRRKRWSLPTTGAEYKLDKRIGLPCHIPKALVLGVGRADAFRAPGVGKAWKDRQSDRTASNTRCETPEADLSLGFLDRACHVEPDQKAIVLSSLLLQRVRSTRTTFSLVLPK